MHANVSAHKTVSLPPGAKWPAPETMSSLSEAQRAAVLISPNAELGVERKWKEPLTFSVVE